MPKSKTPYNYKHFIHNLDSALAYIEVQDNEINMLKDQIAQMQEEVARSRRSWDTEFQNHFKGAKNG